MNLLVGTFLTLMTIVRIEGNLTEFPLQERASSPILGRLLDCNDVDECEDTPGHESKICGTNGKTFKSLCEFMRAYCKEGNVNFKNYGQCSATEKCLGQRRAALRDAKTKKGVFIPGCKSDGTFKPVQCHKDTGYCWCSTAVGHAVMGTDTLNAIPDCINLTKRIPENGSSQRPPIWSKGIPPETGIILLIHEINPVQIPVHTNEQSVSPNAPEGEVDPGLSPKGKKKPKRPRGCEGTRRKVFNRNMLKNMIQEFKRENKNLDIASESDLQSATLHWKFDELNRRKDSKLKKSEYKGLQKIIRRNVKPRKCAKKFPKFCDLNSDKSISLEEWIKCFTSEESVTSDRSGKREGSRRGKKVKLGRGKLTKPRPCEYDQKQALENGNPGAYVPKCDNRGKFRPVQCYGSNATDSWYCFCVDVQTGNMIENTSMRYGTPNCSVLWPKCPPPDKEKKFLKALRSYFVKFAKQKIYKKHNIKAEVVNEENVIEKIFRFIDKNNNNFIEGKERRALKKSISKRDKSVWVCGRKIHVVCDSNSDNKISLQEFSVCVSPRKDHHTNNESYTKRPSSNEFRRMKNGKNPFIELITPE